MDPDEALENARELAKQVLWLDENATVPNEAAEAGVQLALAVQALDEWLVRGGFCPSAWKR